MITQRESGGQYLRPVAHFGKEYRQESGKKRVHDDGPSTVRLKLNQFGNRIATDASNDCVTAGLSCEQPIASLKMPEKLEITESAPPPTITRCIVASNTLAISATAVK